MNANGLAKKQDVVLREQPFDDGAHLLLSQRAGKNEVMLGQLKKPISGLKHSTRTSLLEENKQVGDYIRKYSGLCSSPFLPSSYCYGLNCICICFFDLLVNTDHSNPILNNFLADSSLSYTVFRRMVTKTNLVKNALSLDMHRMIPLEQILKKYGLMNFHRWLPMNGS